MAKDCKEMCYCNDNRQFVCSPKTCVEEASCLRDDQYDVQLCSAEDNCKLGLYFRHNQEISM